MTTEIWAAREELSRLRVANTALYDENVELRKERARLREALENGIRHDRCEPRMQHFPAKDECAWVNAAIKALAGTEGK